MSKTICIYHSVDLDGWMSAAIVKLWFRKLIRKATIDFIGWQYGDDIPNLGTYDQVIMCDISFPEEDMLKLANRLGINFVWVDHHQRSIDEISKYLVENKAPTIDGLTTIEGRDVKAACELTWEWFFPMEKMPEIVRLLGRYDSFQHKGTEEETKVLEFQYGARNCISNYEEAYYQLLNCDIDHNSGNEILISGRTIYSYLKTEAKQIYAKGFEIILQEQTSGFPNSVERRDRKFLCINRERFNPINFGIDYHEDGYDGCACFWYKDGKWSWSLYNDNGKVDCSLIAKQYGGGGHYSASGFIVNNNKFLEIILKMNIIK